MTDLELLGLPSSASLPEIRRRFQELALAHHPDKGGDAPTFIELTQAYKRACAAWRPPACPACNGTRRVNHSSGFNSIRVMCPSCRGSGVAP
jgi:DnaJ-class molecular chaperone